MSQVAFSAAIIGWHDFYLAAAGASAALLGLLFVGVSINLGAIAAQERPDLRARAGLAFSNLIYVLIVSLILLIADPEPHGIAIGLGAVAGIGLVRTMRGLYVSLRVKDRRMNAGRLIREICADMGGSAGGHGSMAGARIPMSGTSRQRTTTKRELVKRFKVAFGAEKERGTSLLWADET